MSKELTPKLAIPRIESSGTSMATSLSGAWGITNRVALSVSTRS